MSPLTKAVTDRLEAFLASPPVNVVPRSNHGNDTRRDTAAPSPPDRQRKRPRQRFIPPSSRGHEYPSTAQRALPAQLHRDRILAAVNNYNNSENDSNSFNNFTLLIGATGCGKSTQLPQLLLTATARTDTDTDTSPPAPAVSIIVAQPRRLAAVSIAHRVSQELHTKVGNEVGYVIRGESRQSDDRTVCTFVTYGVLLKMLTDNDNAQQSSTSKEGGASSKSKEVVLPGVTHLLLDEVHERSSDLDLILLFLKQHHMHWNGKGNNVNAISVTLMSATVDPKAFESYLPGLKVVRVEGRSYPVTRCYFEDAVRDTNYVEMADNGGGGRRARNGRGRTAPLLSDDARGETDAEKEIFELTNAIASAVGANQPERAAMLTTRLVKLRSVAESSRSRGIGASTTRILGQMSLAETQARFELESAAVARSLRSMDHDTIPNDLIGRLVERHCSEAGADGGDILVFLPGFREIEDVRRHLVDDDLSASGKDRLCVLPLHANLQARDQLAAFEPPPRGRTKVILATDVAEASITIPTVTLVIDAGRSRCVLLDPATSLPHLTTVSASRSSLQQRAGRAGRVREGKCYHLIISPLLSDIEKEPTPEILTMPLDTVSLKARVALESVTNGLSAGFTEFILGSCISPPPPAPCQLADSLLLSSGAISSDCMALTRHGRILARTPLSLSHASALVGSHTFGCRVFDNMALLLSALNSTESRPKWAEFDAKVTMSTTSDHTALLGLVRSDARVSREASRLKHLVVSEMGQPSMLATASAAACSLGTMHLVLACLLSSSSQLGKYERKAITYSTEVRKHIVRPHRSSVVCSAASGAQGYAFFGSIIKLPAGPVATDVSIVSDVAAAMFANDCETVGERSELLKLFGGRVKDVFFGREEASQEMFSLLEILLRDLVPPWDGLPDGWTYDEDSKLFRTIEGGIHQRNKPTQPAKVAFAEKEIAKGSLKRAETLLGGKKGRDRGEGPALVTAAKRCTTEIKAKVSDVSDASIKQSTLARINQAEAEERNNLEGGVTRMLTELNLTEKYTAAFESAAVDDAMLDDILLMMKGDEDDKSEAQKGIEDIVKMCGLVGGSAVKVRKYMESGGKRAGKERTGAGTDKVAGDPKRGKKKNQSPTVEVKKTGKTKTKSKKKTDDLSSLESALGGATKAKARKK